MNRLLGAIAQGEFSGILTHQSRRQLIHLHGPDSAKLLHSLTTKNVSAIQSVSPDAFGSSCFFTAFLNDKGRILCDALMYHRPSQRSFWIEADKDCLQILQEHLEKYKMRNQVHLDQVEQNKIYRIYSLVATSEEHQKSIVLWLLNTKTQFDVNFYQDPRWPLALRLIVPFDKNPLEGLPKHIMVLDDSSTNIYTWLRFLNGIPEYPELISGRSIPLELNFEYLNGIDFDKGCYLGQELIARTRYTGLIRKRLFPVISCSYSFNSSENSSSFHQLPPSVLNPLQIGPDSLIPLDLFEKSSEGSACTVSQLRQFYSISNKLTDGANLRPLTFPIEEGPSAGEVKGRVRCSAVTKHIWNVGLAMVQIEHLETAKSSGCCFIDTTAKKLVKIVFPNWYQQYQSDDESK